MRGIGVGGEHFEGKPFDVVDTVTNTAIDGGANIITVQYGACRCKKLGAGRSRGFLINVDGAIITVGLKRKRTLPLLLSRKGEYNDVEYEWLDGCKIFFTADTTT